MKKLLVSIGILLGIGMFISCNHGDNSITHYPFKEGKNSKWGLVNTEGKVLFYDEFENKPSYVFNGVFFVKTTDQKTYNTSYKYYIATNPLKEISLDSCIDGGYCSEGIIPVVKKNSHIYYIDKSGKTVFTLDQEVNGYKIKCVAPIFSCKRAVIQVNKKMGYIDTEGKIVIEPIYDFATGFSENIAIVSKDDKFYAIDIKGNKLFDLSEAPTSLFSEGLLIGSKNVFNKNGDVVFRIPSNIKTIAPFRDGYTVFETEEGKVGIIDKKGEIIFRPVSSGIIYFNKDNIYKVERNEVNKIKLNGEKEKSFENNTKTYDDIYYPTILSDNCCVMIGDDKCFFTDKNGKNIDNNTYYSIDFSTDKEDFVTSDYFDGEKVMKTILPLKNNGIGNIELGGSSQIISSLKKSENEYGGLYRYGKYEGIKDKDGVETRYDFVIQNEAINPKINKVIIYITGEEYKDYHSKIEHALINYLSKLGFTYTGCTKIDDGEWSKDRYDIYKSPNYSYSVILQYNNYSKENSSFKCIIHLESNKIDNNMVDFFIKNINKYPYEIDLLNYLPFKNRMLDLVGEYNYDFMKKYYDVQTPITRSFRDSSVLVTSGWQPHYSSNQTCIYYNIKTDNFYIIIFRDSKPSCYYEKVDGLQNLEL